MQSTTLKARSGQVPTQWRCVIRPHEAADLLPRMSDAELRELGEDIKKRGLQSPVTIITDADGGERLLDGINRLDAMELIGIPIVQNGELNLELVQIHNVAGNIDPHDYVLSANLLRRHLTNEQKTELIAKLLPIKPNASDRQIAKLTRTSHPTVAKVRDREERRGKISTSNTRTDTKGREQPARKPTKLSPTKQWMQDHPDDKPCPTGAPWAAAAWRRARGIMPAKAISKAAEVEKEKEPTEQSPEDSLATRIEGAFGGVRMLLGDESIWPPLNASRGKRLKKALKQLAGAYRELIELAKPVPRRGRPPKARAA